VKRREFSLIVSESLIRIPVSALDAKYRYISFVCLFMQTEVRNLFQPVSTKYDTIHTFEWDWKMIMVGEQGTI
jgi:hypothetical protein